jgi:sugar lactone lactonase YvrE
MIDISTPAIAALATAGILLLRAGRGARALRWDAAGRCWRWPDPHNEQLHAWPAASGAAEGVRLFEGACALASCVSGRVLLGQGKRLGLVDLPAAGAVARPLQAQVLVTVDPAEPRTTISDGCTDRAGNFVFGTANTASDQRPIGSFYQYSPRHGLRRLALPVVVRAAGIAFSGDGKTMYCADGASGRMVRCSYDAGRAKVGNIATFADAGGGLDATVIDSADRLWSVQAGQLVQYAADGAVVRRIALSDEPAAALAFGGEALDRLLVLGTEGGLYGLPADAVDAAVRGVADAPFDDGACDGAWLSGKAAAQGARAVE